MAVEYDDCQECGGFGIVQGPYGADELCLWCDDGRVECGRDVPCEEMCDGNEVECGSDFCRWDNKDKKGEL